MAHYAFLDENSIVTEVIIGKDEGEDGIDWEQWYGEFRGQICKRTSYNTHGNVYYNAETNSPAADQSKAFRKNYAGIGFTYDATRDAFISPKPFPSWVLEEITCTWTSPVPRPQDNNKYIWDENEVAWKIFNQN